MWIFCLLMVSKMAISDDTNFFDPNTNKPSFKSTHNPNLDHKINLYNHWTSHKNQWSLQDTSSTISTFLTTSPTQFPGVSAISLDWVTAISSAQMGGSSILGSPKNPDGYCIHTSVPYTSTSRTYIFWLLNDQFLKMVSVQLTISGYNIYAQAVAAKYNNGQFQYLVDLHCSFF